MNSDLPLELADLVARALALAEPGRAILGIAGPPGAGKTTFALALVAAIEAERPGLAVHVPMDGFHLADVELARLGLADRKGAPDTFDADGYRALLHRLRADGPRETVYAPAFDRELEQPVAGSIPVGPEARLVVSEGNYLLLPEPRWRAAREQCDEVWWVDTGADERTRRLERRHERFGKTAEQARRFVRDVDGTNALLVAPGRDDADLVVPGDLDLSL
ncbi:nucleoside/nucleotide kinase family protein [Brachybacterium huguangmaarense]